MAKKERDISNWTPPRQFRLSAETLAELDYLAGRFALASRAEVIRHLARRAALAERGKQRKEDGAEGGGA